MNSIKQKLFPATISVVLLLSLISSANAVPINGASSGLSGPHQTITFSEINLPPADPTDITTFVPIGNTYSGLGVSFSPNIVYVPQTFTLAAGPNFSEPAAANLAGDGKWLITFNSVLNAVAFAYGSDPNLQLQGLPSTMTTFTALLNGAPVDSFSANTFFGPNVTNNIFGFENSLFDQVQIDVSQFDASLNRYVPANGVDIFIGNGMDNLQFSAVPEPGTFVLLGIGLLFLSLICRRTVLAHSSTK